MKAIGYYHATPIDAPDAFLEIELATPEPDPRDILVKIAAVSVNPVDVKVRAGVQPTTGTARVLGFDAVGTVVALGKQASRFAIGDEVYYSGTLERQGTNAEYQAVDERIVGRKPTSLSAAEAAAMPLTALTAWELLFDRLGITKTTGGESDALLILNGSGGVGSILTQLARKLTTLTIIATASRPETIDWCKQMGAHHVINHHKPLAPQLAELGFPAVRYVAGLTGTGKQLDTIAEIIAPQGALALIDDPEILDIVKFKRKSVSVHWEFMFTRSMFNTPDVEKQGKILNEITTLIDQGTLKTTLRENLGTITAANLTKAHALVESGKSHGKIVLAGF